MLTSKITEDTSRVMVTIQQRVCSGSGQGFRVVDAGFMTHGPRRRQVLLGELYALKPANDMASVKPMVLKIRQILLQLKDTADLPSDGMITGMIRYLFHANPKVAPILASYDLVQGASSAHLLAALESLCIEHRTSVAATKTKEKALVSTGAGRDKDKGSGKGKYKGKDKGKGKGKDKGNMKNPDKQASKKHCEHC